MYYSSFWQMIENIVWSFTYENTALKRFLKFMTFYIVKLIVATLSVTSKNNLNLKKLLKTFENFFLKISWKYVFGNINFKNLSWIQNTICWRLRKMFFHFSMKWRMKLQQVAETFFSIWICFKNVSLKHA